MRWNAFFMVLFCAMTAKAGFYQSDSKIADSSLAQAEALLPRQVKDVIGSLQVQFKDLGSDKHSGFTKEKSAKITINARYLKTLSSERSRNNLLLATILHETMHQYDYKTKLSDEIYFKLAAGVEKDGITFSARTMDAYELKSGAENLATNVEGFLLDPEFQCRRPTMYALLRNRLQHVPFENVACSPSLKLVKAEENGLQVIDLDPNRVYQVHYLFASKGKAAMSRWGHAMVRLIVCDPKREAVGPDCLKDLNSHLTLSFQAVVNGIKLDAIDGIKGDYPSRLNITSMYLPTRQYNMGEQRDVISMPLKMNREQINRLLRRVSEIQWSYDGKYKFFTNNCADETLKLLKIGFLTDDIANLKIATPSSLFQKLQKLGLAQDPINTMSEKAQIEQGYLFKSYAIKYQRALSVVRQLLPSLQSVTNHDEYFSLSAKQRNIFVNEAIQLDGGSKRTAIAALMLLEAGANMVLAREAQQEALKVLSKAEKEHDANRAEELEFLENIQKRHLDFATAIGNTFLMAKGGYGLPKQNEIVAMSAGVSGEEARRMDAKMPSILVELLGGNLEEEMEMEKINMETLTKNLKTIEIKK